MEVEEREKRRRTIGGRKEVAEKKENKRNK